MEDVINYIIKKNIIKEQGEGIFPVIGYSYYEYADELKEKDIYSSMLFAEYSLELSNLEIYFKEEGLTDFKPKGKNNILNLCIAGVILVFISGLAIGIIIGRIKTKPKEKKNKGQKKKLIWINMIIKPRRPPKGSVLGKRGDCYILL